MLLPAGNGKGKRAFQCLGTPGGPSSREALEAFVGSFVLPPAGLCSGAPLEKESVESTGTDFPLSFPHLCLPFSPEESARHCSASHSSQIPDVFPIFQQDSIQHTLRAPQDPPGPEMGRGRNKSCKSPAPCAKMCSGLRRRVGEITLQGFGKEMSSSHIHRQNTKKKKKKRLLSTADGRCWLSRMQIAINPLQK